MKAVTTRFLRSGAVNRRMFLHSLFVTSAGLMLPDDLLAQGQRERRRNGWIIPTNKPDRFNLKVMAFNPIPVPDPAAWDPTPDEEAALRDRLLRAGEERAGRTAQA